MERPRLLLQTSIQFTEDDWHVGRFSLLTAELGKWADVTARNRQAPPGVDDPVLARLDESAFDEMWILAVDAGTALTKNECAAVNRFQKRGGGLLTARDHANMGMWLRDVEGVGATNFFHESWCWEADPDRRAADDQDTPSISFPNYHSGSNGDVQPIDIVVPDHPLLRGEHGPIRRFPAHPHEGAIAAPPGGRARTIARGKSQVSGRHFDLIVALDRADGVAGRAVAHSSFHHFADLNWKPSLGSPTFVTEPPSDAVEKDPTLLDDVKTYVKNCVAWLRPGA